jgi:hypothetical protein
VPKTCSQLGANCGTIADGCGGVIACGDSTCGGGQNVCEQNQCVCKPLTSADCGRLGYTCGASIPDGCGGTFTCGMGLDCGPTPHYCDTTANLCECKPYTCADVGAQCGSVSDGCGHTLNCDPPGGCGQFKVCGTQNTCVCASSVDQPDDLFQDTNCDGIDGNASQAIFVSPLGSDSNAGSHTAPVLTLNRAVALAQSTSLRSIYIASGNYAAPSNWLPGLNLYGGYDTSWNRSASIARAVIVTPMTGFLLSQVNVPTVFERVVFESAPTVNAGDSAQTLRLINCGANISLRYADIIAAAGHAGSTGANGLGGASGANGANGASAIAGAYNAYQLSAPGGVGSGVAQAGGGGIGGYSASPNGSSGGNGNAVGGIGMPPMCGAGPTAGNGANGGVGAAGAVGPMGAGLGVLNSNGLWVPSASSFGGNGVTGGVGFGAGGGGGGGMLNCGAFEAGGNGGGGGAGGSGGFGGIGGGAGGSSVALSLMGSNPQLSFVNITAGAGGSGGTGGAGGVGGPGGAGGSGGNGAYNGTYTSGQGGRGGTGGTGGVGGTAGTGAGGSSIGVVCSTGTTFSGGNGVTITVGAAGGQPGNPFAAQGSGLGMSAQKYGCP